MKMRLTGEREACGMVRVGDDLIAVVARANASALRAGEVTLRWTTTRLTGLFGEGAPPPGALAPHRTLVVATDSLLRREVDSGARSHAEFRAETTGSLASQLPIANEAEALWDVAPLAGGRRVAVCAAMAQALEGTLRRLDEAGVGATRIIPSALAWTLGRFATTPGTGAPGAACVMERTPTGWALHRFDGLAWAGSRSGAGDAPESAVREAMAAGALAGDWRTAPGGPQECDADRVALGAALLELWPGIDAQEHAPPEFDLLGPRPRRRPTLSPFWRWSAVAGLAVVGAAALASAMKHRAATEVASLRERSRESEAGVKKVESLRKANEAVLAAHDRLRKLEANYIPRWWTLGALSSALPASSWTEGVEIGDDWVYADVVTRASAETLQRLEEHEAFEGVRQSGPSVATDAPGETRVRIEARIKGRVGAPGPTPAPGAPVARGASR